MKIRRFYSPGVYIIRVQKALLYFAEWIRLLLNSECSAAHVIISLARRDFE